MWERIVDPNTDHVLPNCFTYITKQFEHVFCLFSFYPCWWNILGIENDLHITSPKAFKLLSVWVCLLNITSLLLKWLLVCLGLLTVVWADPHLVPTSRRQPSGLHSLTHPVCLTALPIISPLKNLDSRYPVGVLRDCLSCFIDNCYYLGLFQAEADAAISLGAKHSSVMIFGSFNSILSVCMCDCDWDHNASG